MNAISLSPAIRVASLPFHPREGVGALAVVAKLTFDLVPGRVRLAATPEDVHERDVHFEDNPRASVYAPGDLAPVKPRADVVLVGSAFAPGGASVRSLLVRLCVAGVDKSIEVFCKRIWTREGAMREGGHWSHMPLRYERAAGGMDTWNPVGIPGNDAPPDRFGQRVAPNLQRPGLTVLRSTDLLPPTGFGPIASTWLLRREKLGERGAAWSEDAVRTEPLGDDFDLAYFQVAPPDQQADALRPDEDIVLENLHREHPRLVTALPGLRPRALRRSPGGASDELNLTADTLWIDTDRARCTLTFRGYTLLRGTEDAPDIVVALEEPGRPFTWEGVSAPEQVRDSAAPLSSGLREPFGMDMDTPIDDAVATVLMSKTGSHKAVGGEDRGVSAGPLAGASLEEQRPAKPLAPQRQSTVTMVASPELRAALPPWASPTGEAGAVSPVVVPVPPPSPAAAPNALSTAGLPAGATLTGAANLDPCEGMPPWLAQKIGANRPGAVVPAPPPGVPGSPVVVVPPPPVVEGAPHVPDDPLPGAAPERHMLYAAYVGLSQLPAEKKEPVWAAPPLPAKAPEPPPPEPLWIELIWFEPTYVPRIHKNEDWAKLMAKALPSPSAPKEGESAADAKPTIVRMALQNVLSKASPMGARDVHSSLSAAFAGEAPALPPLVLLEGELELSFDEQETLSILTRAAAPLAPNDKRLAKVLGLVEEMKNTPFQGSPEILEGFIQQVREAWMAANRSLPSTYLDTHTERVLLERRLYRKRDLLDDTWLRGQLGGMGLGGPVPTYLPASLAKRLPLFRRFAARVIAEALPQQDQYETSPIALRAVALGRALPSMAPPARPGR
jgi:hypothetical protein